MHIERHYKISSKSFFLFGPRGVGKSTWIRSRGGIDFAIDLLNHRTYLELQRDPTLLESKTAHLSGGSTIFIDEIQKIPALLDEVHRLMETRSLEFILTGSSARKLKRTGANLLAGRAHTYKMFPFTIRELGANYLISQAMEFGTLPLVIRDPAMAEETLNSYVETYLREEIKEEALVRKVEEFSRFLAVASQLNTSILNFESIARDTGKSAKTVQSWYRILEETLLGTFIQAFRPGLKVREASHPKFYWFDPGVARIASGVSREDFDALDKGAALETIVLREIQTYLEISRKKNSIFYYAIPGAGEIDFIIETKPKTINRSQEFISIEVKSAKKWKRDFEAPSRALQKAKPSSHKRMLGVYLGEERLTFNDFEVFPIHTFIEELYSGRLI